MFANVEYKTLPKICRRMHMPDMPKPKRQTGKNRRHYHCKALNSLLCADVPLRNYSLTHPKRQNIIAAIIINNVNLSKTI